MADKPEKELQAEALKYGARSVITSVQMDTLTPRRMRNYLLAAEGGDISMQSELFEKMEERDGELDAHLRTRKSGVAQREWTIESADESAPAQRSADLCREMVGAIPDIQEGIFDLLDAIPKGFAVQEIDWETGRHQWRPARLIYRPQRWFQLAADGQTLLLRETSGTGAPLSPFNFVIHRVRARSGFEARTGLLRSCVRAFIVRHFSWKDWMSFAEVYGMPQRLGKLREGVPWDSVEAKSLWTAVRALGMDAYAVMRQGDEIIFGQTPSGEGKIFERILEAAGKELTLAILGQLLTSGGEKGGSYALGEVHNQVRWDLLEADALSLGRTLTEQLLKPIVLLNLGDGAPVPRWHIIIEEPDDLAALATTVQTLGQAGLRIPASWAYKKFGIPEPAGDEETLSSMQGAAGAVAVHDISNGQGASAPCLAASGDALHQAVNFEGPVHADGLAFLQEKRVATPETWKQLSPAGKQRAWFVSGLDPNAIAQTGHELLTAFERGSVANEFLTHLEARGISVPGAEMPGPGQIARSQAGLVYRQNLYSAYGADRWVKAQRGKTLRPYGQYVTAGDERVRPEHAAFDGAIKPLDDPFWDFYTPPWDFNCRCSMVTVNQYELGEEGLTVADEYDEAARYQAAQTFAETGYTKEQFDAAWRPLAARYRADRFDVSGLRVPHNPGWTFNRNEAFYISARGQGPVTAAGQADAGLLAGLPLISELI